MFLNAPRNDYVEGFLKLVITVTATIIFPHATTACSRPSPLPGAKISLQVLVLVRAVLQQYCK